MPNSCSSAARSAPMLRAAEDGNALGNRPQNLLVPDRGRAGEISVDDSDRARPALRGAIEVALGDRRQADEVAGRGDLLGASVGPTKTTPSCAALCRARARDPGA